MAARLPAVLALTLCLLLAGCSASPAPPASAPTPSPSEGGGAGKPFQGGDSGGGKAAGSKDPGSAPARANRERQRARRPVDDGAGDAGSKADPRTEEGIASAVASRSDPAGDGDREGETPPYADLRRAAVAGRGSTVRFTISVDGDIPRAGTGEGVHMTASFRLTMRDGDEHHIYALGSNSGWRAELDDRGRFPGRFSIAGDRFVFELGWEDLGGPSRFRWLAQTSWTRSASGPLDQTDFAFDQVPEYEEASYPE